MAPVIIPGVNIATLTGPMVHNTGCVCPFLINLAILQVLGFMWSYMLYGVLIVQIYMYTEMFPNDRKGLKVLVWVLFFFETFFTILATVAAWSMFGSGWGDVDVLLQLNWSWGLLPLISGVLSALAQGFYIWRIWHLTRRFWWPVAIALTVAGQYVGLWWFGIKWNIAHWHISVLPSLSHQVSVWLAGSALADVLITMALTSTFYRRKQETNIAETTGMLNRLIRLSIETGALTSITATAEFILWIGWERFNYHFALFLVLGKLYSNVLMATLNCRRSKEFMTSGTQMSSFNARSRGDVTVQTAFWCEPDDFRQRLPMVNTGSLSWRGAVHGSRSIQAENNPDDIVIDIIRSPGQQDDNEKASVSARL
ncbi:hypothetical protein MSAN_00270700 [Mycena sanguinolenta]|uniref:DUF6534 domain-containing protein n=1 Tax=Mycena sanguinolenta TaxID=230812 RepID=A0A8H6ZG98_9AGAR|nr:hypothetical protein MSAN_00270700 [Mycena sanguinolenta]